MKRFDYLKPNDLPHALALLAARPELIPLAGGTNIMVDIHNDKLQNGVFLDLRGLAELRTLALDNEMLRIGPMATINMLGMSPLVRAHAPALAMAARVFADPVTRNSATVGGNLLNASPAADMAPPLLAGNAVLLLASAGGTRRVALADFFFGYQHTARRPDELLTAIELPLMPCGAFLKMGLRNAMAISVATAAVQLALTRTGEIRGCRLALGAAAPYPLRAKHAEAALHNAVLQQGELAEAAVRRLAEAVQADISPIDDIRASAAYRRAVIPVLIKRAVHAAWENSAAGRGKEETA